MDANQQKIYDNYTSMFASEGWKQVVETIKEYRQNLMVSGWNGVDNMDKVGQVKGQIYALNMVLNLPHDIEQAANPPKEDDDENAEE